MQSLGYREDLDKYIAFRIHGATAQFVREINTLGYHPEADQLIAFEVPGAPTDFIPPLPALGPLPDPPTSVAFPPTAHTFGPTGPHPLGAVRGENIEKKIKANPFAREVNAKPRVLTLTQSTYDGIVYNVDTITELLHGKVHTLHFDAAWLPHATFHDFFL